VRRRPSREHGKVVRLILPGRQSLTLLGTPPSGESAADRCQDASACRGPIDDDSRRTSGTPRVADRTRARAARRRRGSRASCSTRPLARPSRRPARRRAPHRRGRLSGTAQLLDRLRTRGSDARAHRRAPRRRRGLAVPVRRARPRRRARAARPIGGYFVWQLPPSSRVLLVAGGSGVVPFRAMLRHRLASGSPAEVA